ncbi:MAG: excisionase family DNA-binding protein [Trueperaceae bacterium]|nr:excisionase family DNA-binding protein [Trueperaceae bacterium]
MQNSTLLLLKPFNTTKDIAQRWECSNMHIYRLVERGELRATRIGKLLRFSSEDVLAYEARATHDGEIS